MAYGVDRYGRPTGMDQQAPGRSTPHVQPQAAPVPDYRQRLEQAATDRGLKFDESDYAGHQRQVQNTGAGGTAGVDPEEAYRRQVQIYDQRASSNGGSGGAPQAAAPSAPSVQFPTYQPYNFTRRELPTYAAPTLPTYARPAVMGVEDRSQALIERMLMSPETLSPAVMEAINAKQQEEAVTLEGQLRNRLVADASARGVGGGGWEAAQARRIGLGTNEALLKGRRDLMVQKAMQDRTDQLGAVGAADSFLNNRLSNARADFSTLHSGLLSQEGLRQAENQSAIQRVLFENDQDLQGLDEHRFTHGAATDSARFGEGVRQFNSQMGLNYAQLQQAAQEAMIRNILAGLQF